MVDRAVYAADSLRCYGLENMDVGLDPGRKAQTVNSIDRLKVMRRVVAPIEINCVMAYLMQADSFAGRRRICNHYAASRILVKTPDTVLPGIGAFFFSRWDSSVQRHRI